MMLEQIEAKHAKQLATRNALLDSSAPGKTIGVKVPLFFYDRLAALRDPKDAERNTLKKLALQAMVFGIDALEAKYAPKPPPAKPLRAVDPFASYHA